MLPPKKIVLIFLLRFAGVLTVCLLPWPRLDQVYASAVSAIGNTLVGDQPVGAGAFLHFAVPRNPETSDAHAKAPCQTELSARSAKTRAFVRVPIDLRTLTFIPTAVFIALALASPIWKSARGPSVRGPLVLVSGLFILQFFLAGSIAVPLLLFFSNPQPMPLFQMSPLISRVLDIAYRSLVAPPGMAFAIPGLLWLALLCLIPERKKTEQRQDEPLEALASGTVK